MQMTDKIMEQKLRVLHADVAEADFVVSLVSQSDPLCLPPQKYMDALQRFC